VAKKRKTISPQKIMQGIRHKGLRKVAKAAREQGFELGATRGDHVYLRCPTCLERLTFSMTVSESHERVVPKFVCRLRQHGLVYDGRGGEHTAEPAFTSGQNP